MSDPVLQTGAAPETHRLSFIALLFGASAAPIAWLGQVMLAYGVSSEACYPGDHPVAASGNMLHGALIAFDAVTVAIALAGGVTAFWCLRRARRKQAASPPEGLKIRAARAHFLALWAILSSLCFLAAILFNIIASVTVPACAL